MRPSSQIHNRSRRRVDTHVVVKRGENFLKRYWSLHGLATVAIGGANDLPVRITTAGQDGARNIWPVVAPAIFIDFVVRPNSPQAITVVVSNNPRWSKSSISALMPGQSRAGSPWQS